MSDVRIDRRDWLLSQVSKEELGLEIAPWVNPLVPKQAGFNARTLDVFDFETLVARAKEDPKIPEESYGRLEGVDYVGSACDLAQIVPEADHGTFDYIISSHNFEHLPDPIKFLQGCAVLLRPGGHVTMAVPDMRGCFDYFRPWTVTADWIEAYLEGRDAPNERSIYEYASNTSVAIGPDGTGVGGFPFNQPIASIEHFNKANVLEMQKALLAEWSSNTDKGYIDCHCTVMTPASLELMLLECIYLDLVPLEIERIQSFGEGEFFIRLRKPVSSVSKEPNSYADRRDELMRQTLIERKQAIAVSRESYDHATNITMLDALRLWNTARLRRRRARRAAPKG